MNKRGVSEVVAAVLLVAIVIVIIGIIAVWSFGFVQKSARESREKLYCDQLDIAIKQACYEENTTKIVIKNYKNITIEHDSVVRLEGDKSYADIPFPPFSEIGGLEMGQLEISYDKEEIGDLEKVVFFPKLSLDNIKFFCEGIENEIKAC